MPSPIPNPEPPIPKPLGVVHGYGLAGAGSNLWTRAILRALAQDGHTVHAVCQESRPEAYEFVSEAWAYDEAGEPRVLLDPRETPHPGRVVVHRPDLAVLPTYVRPSRPSDYVVYIPDLDDLRLHEYVERNARVLRQVAREHGVTGWVVNHTVLMAVAAQRAHAQGGAPYAVLPHGSAIEYVVKKEKRSRALADDALAGAARVFALNGEMESRIRDVFAVEVPGLEAKMSRMPVGTDTSIFQALPREARAGAVAEIGRVVRDAERGRTAARAEALRQRLAALPDDPDDEAVLLATRGDGIAPSAPDADLEAALGAIDWTQAKTVLYVGRLIAAKGPDAVLMAFPRVKALHPEARLLVAGMGGLRDGLEALAWALAEGREALVRQLVRLGGRLEGGGGLDASPLFASQGFLDALDAAGESDAFFDMARRVLRLDDVVFTGFLDHDALGPLYGLADVAAFPSVVREASPLVVPESAAAGVLPVGPDVGGMGDSLRALAAGLPEAVRPLLLVRPEAEHRVADLADHLSAALDAPRRYAADLRREAEARFDWRAIATRLADELQALA